MRRARNRCDDIIDLIDACLAEAEADASDQAPEDDDAFIAEAA